MAKNKRDRKDHSSRDELVARMKRHVALISTLLVRELHRLEILGIVDRAETVHLRGLCQQSILLAGNSFTQENQEQEEVFQRFCKVIRELQERHRPTDQGKAEID